MLLPQTAHGGLAAGLGDGVKAVGLQPADELFADVGVAVHDEDSEMFRTHGGGPPGCRCGRGRLTGPEFPRTGTAPVLV